MKCKECREDAAVRGFCRPHYNAANYRGEIKTKPISRGMSPVEKVALRTRPGDKDGCFIWTGGKNRKGYGQLGFGGHNHMAHRVAWEAARGRIPDGLMVLHSCDNPPCVNVAHLFLGTNQDNMNDMRLKGRQPKPLRGAKNPTAKLMDKAISAIRRDPRVYRLIAVDHGISTAYVGQIKRRERWVHI